jgi:Rha family phage regulatory protein
MSNHSSTTFNQSFQLKMTNQLSTPQTGQPTISSLEIAHITGKQHNGVLKDIRRIFAEAEIGLGQFSQSYRNAQNKVQPCYNLPRRESDLVASGYSVKYRLAIIDRWQELESKQSFEIPQTRAAALRLAAELEEKVAEQSAALAIAAPKVEFFDTVMSSNTVCQMAVAAQVAKLPYWRNILFQKLREDEVLISGGDRHNMPKQAYIKNGYFTVEETGFKHPKTEEPIVKFTTHVTQKGLDFIIKKYGKKEAA